MAGQTNHVGSADGNNKSLYEPAFITIYITALLYLVGYAYFDAFFNRLSIPYLLLSIQPIDYITALFIPILILGICITIFFSVWSHYPRNISEALQGNLIMICIFSFYSIFFLKLERLNEMDTLIIVTCIIVILYIIYMSYKMESVAYSCFNNKLVLIMYLLAVIISIYNLGSFIGRNDAKNLIEGNNYNNLEISFKDKTNNQFLNKTLILVMLHDNVYYVIEKNATTSNYHKLYIIPTEQVEMVTIIRK